MLFAEAFIIIFMYQPFLKVSFIFLHSNYQWRRIIKGSNLSVENNSSWITKYILINNRFSMKLCPKVGTRIRKMNFQPILFSYSSMQTAKKLLIAINFNIHQKKKTLLLQKHLKKEKLYLKNPKKSSNLKSQLILQLTLQKNPGNPSRK